ncbi:MAG: HEPN domain-containing protein [Planctomycetaceae bacterium]|nr:HEPN domain-containing protein [Planctomycetaceae bacterium]
MDTVVDARAMALPPDSNASRFFRAGFQRLEDAQVLFRAGRNQGAQYLAGYAVECVLKALILHRTPGRRRAAALNSFRGARGHDLEWLWEELRHLREPPATADVQREFARLVTWGTGFRYEVGTIKQQDAAAFVAAAEGIAAWVHARIRCQKSSLARATRSFRQSPRRCGLTKSSIPMPRLNFIARIQLQCESASSSATLPDCLSSSASRSSGPTWKTFRTQSAKTSRSCCCSRQTKQPSRWLTSTSKTHFHLSFSHP